MMFSKSLFILKKKSVRKFNFLNNVNPDGTYYNQYDCAIVMNATSHDLLLELWICSHCGLFIVLCKFLYLVLLRSLASYLKSDRYLMLFLSHSR
jgi:hypothetical protein